MILTQVISRVVFFRRAHRKTLAFFRAAACAVLASAISPLLLAANTVVRMEVSYGANTGNIDIELYDDLAPKTVANFLRYAGRGYYTSYIDNELDVRLNGFFHFSTPGFAIRGGGYAYSEDLGFPFYIRIPEDPPIPNESSPSRPNNRGTMAMFNPPGIPDGITSQWTINLADNTTSINIVFGRVVAGMEVADAIGSLPNYDARGTFPAFSSIPLNNYDPAVEAMQPRNLARVLRIPNVAGTRVPAGGWAIFTADKDMTFDALVTVHPVIAEFRIGSFKSPPGHKVHFNNDMIALLLSGPPVPDKRVVVMYDGASERPTHYYAYGPTPDDPSNHWYDFSYDGVTGAEIKSDRIILHLADGKRGDYNLAETGKIEHTGTQAVITPIDQTQAGGCSITAAPSRMIRGGDWALVTLFLAILVASRKRTCRDESRQERS